MGQIFNVVINWCCSIRGILTFLIIAVTANRIVLTDIREKHGKESQFYHNSKLISGAIFLVIIVNCLGALGKWIFSLGILANLQSNSSLVTNLSTINPWVATSILAIIYITMMSSACKRLKNAPLLTATVILIFGIHIIHDNPIVTGVVTFISLIIALGFSIDNDQKLEFKKAEAKKKANDAKNASNVPEPNVESTYITKKGVLLIITWAASVVVAYMAGEYSLVPKAVEYVQNLLKKRTEATAEGTPTSDEEETTELITTE